MDQRVYEPGSYCVLLTRNDTFQMKIELLELPMLICSFIGMARLYLSTLEPTWVTTYKSPFFWYPGLHFRIGDNVLFHMAYIELYLSMLSINEPINLVIPQHHNQQ